LKNCAVIGTHLPATKPAPGCDADKAAHIEVVEAVAGVRIFKPSANSEGFPVDAADVLREHPSLKTVAPAFSAAEASALANPGDPLAAASLHFRRPHPSGCAQASFHYGRNPTAPPQQAARDSGCGRLHMQQSHAQFSETAAAGLFGL